jgi:hypothetical protein
MRSATWARSKVYELVAASLLPIVPLPGRRKLVGRAVLERLVDAPEPAAERLSVATNGDQYSNPRPPARTAPAAARPRSRIAS